MQLVVAVFMIRVIIALISDKTKDRKNIEQVNDKPVDARHPAGFQIR
ncbi:hypothetical protein SAMN05660816_00367 [Niastella yeongjuensis]|nr:hypothetical protein SAMN05660816_00367 [Niastella yeongjuensis]